MNTGLMWFDNDPQTPLAVKIEKASTYYKKKFGRLPELCLVNPSMMGNQAETNVEQHITIRAFQSVLPGHLWIGVEEQNM